MSNYAKYSLQTDAIRTELHDELNLTGCEISCNQMPAGAAVPFVHKHKENEEVYIITQGGGEFASRRLCPRRSKLRSLSARWP